MRWKTSTWGRRGSLGQGVRAPEGKEGIPTKDGSMRSVLERSRVSPFTWEENLKPAAGSPRGVNRHVYEDRRGWQSECAEKNISVENCKSSSLIGDAIAQVRWGGHSHWWGRWGSKQVEQRPKQVSEYVLNTTGTRFFTFRKEVQTGKGRKLKTFSGVGLELDTGVNLLFSKYKNIQINIDVNVYGTYTP